MPWGTSRKYYYRHALQTSCPPAASPERGRRRPRRPAQPRNGTPPPHCGTARDELPPALRGRTPTPALEARPARDTASSGYAAGSPSRHALNAPQLPPPSSRQTAPDRARPLTGSSAQYFRHYQLTRSVMMPCLHHVTAEGGKGAGVRRRSVHWPRLRRECQSAQRCSLVAVRCGAE